MNVPVYSPLRSTAPIVINLSAVQVLCLNRKNNIPLVMKILLALVISLTLLACDQASKPTRSIEVASVGLHAAALSEQAEFATAGSIYHGASFWHVQDAERVFNWNHNSDEATTVVASDFSDNNQWALTANPHTMVLWDTRSGKGERYWTAPAEILDAELDQNGRFALLGLTDHTAVIFDIQRGGIQRTFTHKNRVRSVDFSKDGRIAITGSEDYSASIWNTQSGERISTIMHDDDVQLVKLSDDGSIALSVSKYDKALLWKTQSNERIAEIPLRAEHLRRGIRFTAARFSSDNQFLLTGRPDRIVQLWQVSPIKELTRWKLPKRNAWKPTSTAVIDVSFSGNSHEYYAVGSSGFIHTLEFKNEMP